MIKVKPGPNTVKGIDVSHHDGLVDWPKYKSLGIEFAYVKATEGLNYVDPRFEHNRKGAKDAGVLFGAYHFFHPGKSAKDQALHFLKIIGNLDSSDLPPCLDWETTDGVPSMVDTGLGLQFLGTCERTGKNPIIYGSPYFLKDLTLDSRFSKYSLWIAHYGVSIPMVPDPWRNWQIWQYSENGYDHNIFNGTLDDLKRL